MPYTLEITNEVISACVVIHARSPVHVVVRARDALHQNIEMEKHGQACLLSDNPSTPHSLWLDPYDFGACQCPIPVYWRVLWPIWLHWPYRHTASLAAAVSFIITIFQSKPIPHFSWDFRQYYAMIFYKKHGSWYIFGRLKNHHITSFVFILFSYNPSPGRNPRMARSQPWPK